MHQYLSGVQQIGIGVKNAQEAMYLYKELFAMDVLVFDDVAPANLMTQYTGNAVHNRRAILTMNLKGGGGFEIWQYTERIPKEARIELGDIGIYAAILKSDNVLASHNRLSKLDFVHVSELIKEERSSSAYFWLKDGYENTFKIIESNNWFQEKKHNMGGVAGAVIGVSSMEKSIDFYQNVLALDEIMYDVQSTTNGKEYRKVGLHKKATGKGAFNKLLGDVTVELVQILNASPKKIFENRYWGDCGFIHLCFDVLSMNKLKKHAKKFNYNFTVDSDNTFQMDNASGHFCYVEDPDGTLIELVETHKVPIFKKMGWFLDLRKRDFEKPLPNWMIKMLALSKVK